MALFMVQSSPMCSLTGLRCSSRKVSTQRHDIVQLQKLLLIPIYTDTGAVRMRWRGGPFAKEPAAA